MYIYIYMESPLYMGYGWIWLIHGLSLPSDTLRAMIQGPTLSSMNALEEITGDTGVLSPQKMLAQYGAIIKQQLGVSENRVLHGITQKFHGQSLSSDPHENCHSRCYNLLKSGSGGRHQRDQLYPGCFTPPISGNIGGFGMFDFAMLLRCSIMISNAYSDSLIGPLLLQVSYKSQLFHNFSTTFWPQRFQLHELRIEATQGSEAVQNPEAFESFACLSCKKGVHSWVIKCPHWTSPKH